MAAKPRDEVVVKKLADGFLIQLRERTNDRFRVISELALTPAQTRRMLNQLKVLGMFVVLKGKESRALKDQRKRNSFKFGRKWTGLQHLNRKVLGRPVKKVEETNRSLSSAG